MSATEKVMDGQIVSYEVELEAAMKRTQEWGLPCPSFAFNSRRFLTPTFIEGLIGCTQRVTGHLGPRDIAGQCFAVHHFIKDAIEQDLGVPLLYTIGYVTYESGRAVFHTEVTQLKAMLDRGPPLSGPLSLHAWLTMPSHEILDLTFGTTYGVVHGIEKLLGTATFTHPSELKHGMRYHPQLVGTDYFHRIGAITELPNVLFS